MGLLGFGPHLEDWKTGRLEPYESIWERDALRSSWTGRSGSVAKAKARKRLFKLPRKN